MLYSLAIILVLVYGIGKRYIHLFVDSISSCSSQSEQGCHTPCRGTSRCIEEAVVSHESEREGEGEGRKEKAPKRKKVC